MLLLEDEETHWRSVETLPPTKLGQVSASEWAALAKADAYVFFPGPADIARYRTNLTKSQAATSYNSEWYRRAEKGGLRVRGSSSDTCHRAGRDLRVRLRCMAVHDRARRFCGLRRDRAQGEEARRPPVQGNRRRNHGTERDAIVGELKGRAAESDDGIVDAQDLKNGEFMTNVPPGYVIVCPTKAPRRASFGSIVPVRI